jgi:hypothetical protein
MRMRGVMEMLFMNTVVVQSIEVSLASVCTEALKKEVLAIESEISRKSPRFVFDAVALLKGITQKNEDGKQVITSSGRAGSQIRTNLYVPYDEKDHAKALGAKWDGENKTWYCLGDAKVFSKWLSKPKIKNNRRNK